MNQVQGIHHIALSVPDIEKARYFYIGLLGAVEVAASEWGSGVPRINAILGLEDSAAKSFMARLSNAYIEVFEYLIPRPAPQTADRPVHECGYTHFCLQVDDIEAVYRRMSAAGIRFHCPPIHSGAADEHGHKTGFIATYGRDFFGNVFELLEVLPDSRIPPL